ncbi:MAG: helix-turn-helix domain-containing protein, partial [Nitriliruptoraceae bacterium]
MDEAEDPPGREQAHGSLGGLVRERRIAMGLTQRQAARRAGVSLATWQSVERPSSAPDRFTELTLSRVASGLRLSSDTVFAAAGRPAPSGVVPPAVGGSTEDEDDVEARIAEVIEQL